MADTDGLFLASILFQRYNAVEDKLFISTV